LKALSDEFSPVTKRAESEQLPWKLSLKVGLAAQVCKHSDLRESGLLISFLPFDKPIAM
jgi:hypothetical protein